MKDFIKKIKNIILLQAVVIIYTFTSIVGKIASDADVMSAKFIGYYALDIMILGVYAICWQQMLKRFDLAVAYANRAMAILWTGVWAVVFFKDNLSIRQIAGIVIVMIGTVIVNLRHEESDAPKEEREAVSQRKVGGGNE